MFNTARSILRLPKAAAADSVTLTYDDRFLRRKRLTTVGGLSFMVNLPETVSLNHGDAFELDDGRLVTVHAAEEPVVVITGPGLTRFAWHIGNRHTPCQIEPARLLIRQDHVIESMVAQLGATLTRTIEPFTPEGGAYGHGRTMGHDHGPGPIAGHALGSGLAQPHAPAFDAVALFPFAKT